jgi:DegV family protein with EDD domain
LRPVIIFTDSTSDLPEEITKKHEIVIIPLYVNFGQQSYKDNEEIKPAELFRKVKETGKLPMTSAPTEADFANEFKKYIDQGMDILHISISSKISSSYQNACIAATQFPEGRIKVIDSLNLSSGIGILVMVAADCVEKDMSLNDTVSAVQPAIAKVRAEFAIDTMEYLHKGGRCSGLQFLMSSLLEIHPIIAVNDGMMHVAAKIRGNREAVLRRLIKDAVDNVVRINPKRMVVNNCECADDAALVKTQLADLKNVQQIVLANASCVIASHCGPKTIGIFYLEK